MLPVGRPCKSYLRQLDEAAGVKSPLALLSSSTEMPYLLSETGSVAPDLWSSYLSVLSAGNPGSTGVPPCSAGSHFWKTLSSCYPLVPQRVSASLE